MASNQARLYRQNTTLMAEGTLDRAAATRLWPQLSGLLEGAESLDLAGVTQLDSAGLALLAEAAAQLRKRSGTDVTVAGNAPGLDALRAAYRLSPTLDFQA